MNASEISCLFLPPMDCVKNLILSEAAIERCCTKQELHSSKSCKVAGFQPLITTAMWTIQDAAEFLAFTHRKKDGYFNFNAVSGWKVFIDF